MPSGCYIKITELESQEAFFTATQIKAVAAGHVATSPPITITLDFEADLFVIKAKGLEARIAKSRFERWL